MLGSFYIATNDGIVQWDLHSQPSRHGPDEAIYQIASVNGALVGLGEESRIWEYNGSAWSASEIEGEVSAESLLTVGNSLYVGTEPTRVFRKRLGEKKWQLVGALDEMPISEDFHTPWGGPAAIRTMAAKSPEQFYLDIHVGGIIRTRDGGKSWEPINNGLEEDVHQVATHALARSRVYAATADGFYLSEDEGNAWQRRNNGLTSLYCRGIAIHPKNPDLILISGSPVSPPYRRTGPQFSVFRSDDTGRNWKQIENGLPCPASSEIDTNCIAFLASEPDAVAVGLESGELFISTDAGVSWNQAAKFDQINSICC